jgi:flagellin FlaB
MKRDNAFTGLEAAIVLIAFVVVAAIFSYVLLGAGFFATQKAQEVTYAGIKQSVSNAVLDGSMYARTDNGNLTGLMFNVRIPLGGEAIDMNTTTFIFASSRQNVPILLNLSAHPSTTNKASGFQYPTVPYTIRGYYPDAGNAVLTSGEFATFMLNIGADSLEAKDWFTLEMRPRIGAATLISKTLGSGVVTGDTM